ncbi:zinc finger protein 135-like [Bradysia coprophila]|uniref:zinc finger protein 135-like n=1 Tax=Bradysia coprophila TaxID=38358 RepID=UPI00187D72FB|nr:zinc finger protein 135-like [Bradysia coprophila]
MEVVWLKTEPDDDTVKLETGIDVNAELLTIISQDASNNSCCEAENASIEIGGIQDPTAEYDVKCIIDKRHNRKRQLGKMSATKSDGEKVEKKGKKQSCVCDVCDKEFSRPENLRRHKLLHSDLRPYVCPEQNCGANFRQSYALKLHRRTHDADRKSDERKFFCEVCGLGFQSKFYLQFHHRSKHSGERPYVCSECGQGFAQRRGLTKHQLEHSGNRPFECDECEMRFYSRSLLKSHKKTHTAVDGKPFNCSECGKGFYHKTSLNAHQRNHLTIRPFGCEICGKRFTQNGALSVHKVIHSDVRPYGCEECGLRFTQQYTLKTHRMKQHGLSTAPLKQQKTAVQLDRISVTGPAPKTVTHDEQSSYDHVQSLESSEISAIGSTDIVPFNTPDLNESKDATESGTESQQPLITIKIEKSVASESSCSESWLETNDDESTEFEDKFSVDHSTDTLQSLFVDSTVLTQIKEEEETTEIDEPSLDIWKSEPTTSDDHNASDKGKLLNKDTAAKNSCDESTERPFSCNECERRFVRVSALKIHQRAHERAKKEKSSCICDECGKTFSGKKNLKVHQRIHSGSTPYSCKECGKNFNQLANMITHQLTHASYSERRFACETCGSKFSRKDTLEHHRRTHTDDRNFECDVCGSKFKTALSMKRHRWGHSADTNYACDICSKTFYSKSYMTVHLRTHTGSKPFACDLCPYRSNENSQVKRHKKYSHREIGAPSEYQRLKLKKMMKTKKMADDSL